MDKQLLDALSGVNIYLDKLAAALSANTAQSSVSNALKSGNFGKHLEIISNDIKDIKSNQKKILSNTETILELQRRASENKFELFNQAATGRNTAMIREGVGVIDLISGAVLSLGRAFESFTNFPMSNVISFSESLPVLANSFEKVSDLGLLSFSKFSKTLINMAREMTEISSVKLNPISEMIKMLIDTSKQLNLFSTTNFDSIVKMVKVLTDASKEINSIKVISDLQSKTLITLSGLFEKISTTSLKLKELANLDVSKISTSIVQLSSSINTSSIYFSLMKTLSPLQQSSISSIIKFITELSGEFSKINITPVKISQIIPLSTIISSAMSILYPVKVITPEQNKSFLSLTEVLLQSTSMAEKIFRTNFDLVKLSNFVHSVSEVIVFASQNISKLKFIPRDILGSFLDISSIISSSVNHFVEINKSIVGIPDITKLSGSINSIVNILSESSKTLSSRDFRSINLPTKEFVNTLISSLSEMIKLNNSTNLNKDQLTNGSTTFKLLSQNIVDVSKILSNTSIVGDLSTKWYEKISNTLESFVKLFDLLRIKKISISDTLLLENLSKNIVSSSSYFSKLSISNVSFDALKKEADSLTSFIPIYESLSTKSIYLNDATRDKLLFLAEGVMKTNQIFSKDVFSFDQNKIPNSAWSDSVSRLFSSFIGIFEKANLSTIDFKNSNSLLTNISKSITDISKEFSGGVFTNFPSENWINGTIYALQNYQKILELVNFNDKNLIGNLGVTMGNNSGVTKMSNDINVLADSFQKLGLSMAVFSKETLDMNLVNDSFDKLGTTLTNFSQSTSSIDTEKISMIKGLMNSVTMISLLDSKMFDSMMSSLEKRGGVFMELMQDFETKKTKSPVASEMKTIETTTQTNNIEVLSQKLDNLIGLMGSISSVVGVSGVLDNYLKSIKENQLINTSHIPSSINRSDKRLKNIIKKVGVSDSGINIYHFSYTFNPNVVYQGVIAQELLNSEFEISLISDKNGFYSVDYSKIDVEFKKITTT